jgi:hypothetical protein
MVPVYALMVRLPGGGGDRGGGGEIEEAEPEEGGWGRPNGEARTEGRRKEGLLLDWELFGLPPQSTTLNYA